MTAWHFGLAAVLFMGGVGSVLADKKEGSVVVDLRAGRGEIRAVLLRYTPVGSSGAKVLEFVSGQLKRAGDTPIALEDEPAERPAAEESNKRGVKRIHIFLGQYYDHPEVVFLSAPLMMQKEVSAQWAFDQHDRLIDIFVDKKSGLY